MVTLSGWNWSFGDGNVSADPNPVHTFSVAGNYSVNLSSLNSCGNSNSSFRSITVNGTVCPDVVSNFSSNVSSGEVPLTVSFTDSSTGGTLSGWNWSFGDGTVSADPNPVHTFSVAGNYSVNLSSLNSCGNSNSSFRSITVNGTVCPDVVSNFSSNLSSGEVPLTVSFTDSSTGGTLSGWNWSFGDGTVSADPNPVHTFSVAGNYSVNLSSLNSCGNSNSSFRSITVNGTVCPDVVANFSSNVSSGEVPLTVSFTDSSTGGTLSGWNWSFGDGTVSADPNPVHTFSVAGNYSVNLSSLNSCGNSNSSVHVITVSTVPCPSVISGFNSNVSNGTAPLTVSFTDSSTGGTLTGWNWNFGDGNISTVQNPVHTFSSAGSYSVNLSSLNSCGNSNSSVHVITVNTVPCPSVISGFSSNVSNGTAPLTVSFTDSSTGGTVTGWNWNFGDGNVSTVQNPVHTFSSAGTYSVNMSSLNSCGNSNSSVHVITVNTVPCPSVISGFSSNVSNGTAPLTVSFTDSSTGGTITGWNWNFGDGNISTVQNPVHTFSSAGTYSVNMSSLNSCGNSNSSVHVINVNTVPCPSVISGFSSNVSNGTAPLTVTFTDSSTGGTITGWNWNFGDGNISTVQNPVHTFSSAGTYSVNMSSLNSCGNSNSSVHVITVNTVPCPSVISGFSSNVSNGTAPLTVTFIDSSTGGTVTGWNWNFGDGNVSTVQNPVHTFSSAGNYSVNLSSLNSCGNSNSVLHVITVNTVPCPSVISGFSSNVSNGTAPLIVSFTDSSTGGTLTGWNWNFGDGNISTVQNPVHTFSSAGNYSVNLSSLNSCGNSNSALHVITVSTVPCPSVISGFSSNVSNGTAPLTVTFTDSSTGGTVTGWNWNFGDGNISTVQNPVHTFSSAGNYSVNLSSLNSCGNSNSALHVITVSTVPCPTVFANFTSNVTTGTAPLTVSFTDMSIGGAIDTWEWQFGDGSPTIMTRNSTHLFSSAGTYRVNLTAGNNCGNISSVTHEITVNPVPTVTPTPTVTITPTPTGTQMVIINSSANEWSNIVPKGNRTYPENSNQTYITQAKPGSTLLDVQVDSISQGVISNWTFTNLTKNHDIYANGTPTPGQVQVFFNASPRYGALPLQVTFSDQSIGSPTSFYWQFGDGTTSTEQNPTHTYGMAGKYPVALQSKNNQTGGYGMWDGFITVTNGVVPEPTPTQVPGDIISGFTVFPMNGTAPLSVQFIDTSSGNPVSWLWDFGDGTTSTLQNPIHEYTAEGSYSVTILAQNSKYCGSLTKPNAVIVH